MAKQDFQSAVIKAKLEWANFADVNDLSGKFQVDCTQLNEDDAEKLRTIGLTPKVCDNEEYNRGVYITPKSNMKAEEWRKDEDDLRWFGVTYVDKRPIEDLRIVGNGTEAYVRISAVPYTFKKKDGITPSLELVVITKMVEYNGAEDSEIYDAAQDDLEVSLEESDDWSEDEEV